MPSHETVMLWRLAKARRWYEAIEPVMRRCLESRPGRKEAAE
jgi:hypothetical protein